MKSFSLSCLLVFAATLAEAQLRKPTLEEVAAKRWSEMHADRIAADADGTGITLSDVRRQVDPIVGQIRARWPRVRILLRADSGFCREPIMAWCEAHRVDYVFGLARNVRLTAEIETEMQAACAEAEKTGKSARQFKDFQIGRAHV